MSSFIFLDGQANNEGSLHCIAATGKDTSSFGNGYKIIACTDEQYNNIKLEKVLVKYDSSDNLVITNAKYGWTNHAGLRETIDGTAEPTTNAANKACVVALKAEDFSSETFPLTKSIPELAEEKGISWTALFEIPTQN